MSRRHPMLEETLATLRAAGFAPVVKRGKHIKVMWIDDAGTRRTIVLSFTPSDHRALYTNRRVLRGLMVPRRAINNMSTIPPQPQLTRSINW
jgi:hypothetical protein